MNDAYAPLCDAELARLAVRDERAFEALVSRHAGAIHRLAALNVGPGAADDVVQDVFIAVHRGLGGFRGEAQFSTWLHRITLNACSKALGARQNIPFEDMPEPAAPHDPAHAGEQAEQHEPHERQVGQLPDPAVLSRQRRITE